MKITIGIPNDALTPSRVHRLEQRLNAFMAWLEQDLPENAHATCTVVEFASRPADATATERHTPAPEEAL